MSQNPHYTMPELEEFGTFRELTLGRSSGSSSGGGKRMGINDLASVFNQQNQGCNPNSAPGSSSSCILS